MAIGTAAAIIGGAALGSAVIGGVASNRAARAQERAADEASDLQWDMFQQNREDMAPWREAGVGALGRLSEGIGADGEFMRDFSMDDFEADPGYQFRIDEGMRALRNSAAARGMLRSGQTLKAITRYGQEAGSQEYMNAFNRYRAQVGERYNRLAGVSGTGQAATSEIGRQGANTAANMAANTMAAGNARASGYMGIANAAANGLGQFANFYQNQAILNAFARPPGAM